MFVDDERMGTLENVYWGLDFLHIFRPMLFTLFKLIVNRFKFASLQHDFDIHDLTEGTSGNHSYTYLSNNKYKLNIYWHCLTQCIEIFNELH